MQNNCAESPKKWTFSVSENFENVKEVKKGETWHGAIIWLHNAVVKIWDGLETVAM